MDESGRGSPQIGEIFSTRLAPPSRADGLVPRDKLLGLLDDLLTRRLTVVHAGAGYGKTSLLTQWLSALRARGVATAWLTAEEDEAAPAALLGHIIAACTRAGHMDPTALAGVGPGDDRASVQSLATAFIDLVADRHAPLVIFLDEFNRAHSSESAALLRMLIRNSPAHLHFVIASRWRPEIDIEKLRIHGDLLDIGTEELRFGPDEVRRLLASSGTHLSDGEIHRLTDRTEGWPIALQMVRLWLDGDGARAHLISDFSGRTADLARYMTEQVLSALPADDHLFLMQTAILDRVNGDLANAITGRHDGWLVLERLCERNLFITPEDQDRKWFSYHTLFRDFLRDRALRYHGDRLPDLHGKAARWLAERGMVRRAVHHALAADDHGLAAELLSAAGGWRLVMDGRINLLRSSLDLLSDNIVREHAPLALARVFLLIKDGDIAGAHRYFESLEGLETAGGSDTDREVVGRILSDYVDEAVTLDEIKRLQDLRRRIPRHDHLVQAILADSVAAKYYEFGMFEPTLDACDDAIARYRLLGSFYGEVFLRFTQAKSRLAQGRLDEAEVILRQTEKELALRFGESLDLSAQTAIHLAEVLTERDALDDAAALLEQALPAAEQSDGWFELYASAYGAAAAVARLRGGADAALEVFERARRMAEQRKLERLALFADCGAVQYLALDGRIADAAAYQSRLEHGVGEGGPASRMARMAATRLAMIHMEEGRGAAAKRLLKRLIAEAESRGEVRQLIELRLLTARCALAMGAEAEAARLLDRAVRDGLFTGLKRAYLDYGRSLLPVIDRILSDRELLPPDRYRDTFLRDLRRDLRRADRRLPAGEFMLKPVEIKVLRELDHGFSNKEIAGRLGMSPNTVKYHMKGLFAKLGASNRMEAVKISRERELLSRT